MQHDPKNSSVVRICTHTITFGPALLYSNDVFDAQPAHISLPDETDTDKCITNHTWAEIIQNAKTNPHVFDKCLENACPQTVDLCLYGQLKNQTRDNYYFGTGHGPGALYEEIAGSWTYWNPANPRILVKTNKRISEIMSQLDSGPDNELARELSELSADRGFASYCGVNTGGWPASRIRAMLNGDCLASWAEYQNLNSKIETDEDLAADPYCYADSLNGDVLSIRELQSYGLLACFPAELRAAIIPKAVRSDTFYGSTDPKYQVVTWDPLWLPSMSELGLLAAGASQRQEGDRYPGFAIAKFSNYPSLYYKYDQKKFTSQPALSRTIADPATYRNGKSMGKDAKYFILTFVKANVSIYPCGNSGPITPCFIIGE